MKKTILTLSLALVLSACASNSKKKPSQTPPETQPIVGGQNTTPTGTVMQVTLTKDTRFRANSDLSNDYTDAMIPENDIFCRLQAGQTFAVTEHKGMEGKFYAVTLSSAPGTCSFAKGYFFMDHVSFSGQ